MKITPEQLRDISEKVYRKRLEDDCKGNVERMLAKDSAKDPNDNGQKLRGRAGSYDLIVRATLEVIGYEPA